MAISGQPWGSTNQFPLCQNKSEENYCIEKFSITQSDGNNINLEYKGDLPGDSWPANPQYGSPASALVPLYKTASDNADSGYFVVANMYVKGSFKSNLTNTSMVNIGVGRYRNVSNGVNCLWTLLNISNNCGKLTHFNSGDRIQLVLHISKTQTNWFSGRLKDADIQIDSLSKDFNRLSISAEPVTVPVFAVRTSCDGALAFACGAAYRISYILDHGPTFFNQIVTATNNTATYEVPAFSLSNNYVSKYSKNAKCKSPSDKITGFVTTNSSMATSGIPTFDGNTLNYSMSSLHFDSKGEIFKGIYDLYIESNYARCLWGLNLDPIQANITITSTEGTNQVATTLVDEKEGYIHLAARGFNFSSPVVKVQLFQSGKKSSKIDCVKGKSTKQFEGIKCPTGFKKA